MPREVKAYGCEFRCGHRVNTKRATMERHEEICWKNPARRTCLTCEHESVERGLMPEEGWDGRSCYEGVLSGPSAIAPDPTGPGPIQRDLDPVNAPHEYGGDWFVVRVNCWLWEPRKEER